MSLRAKRSNLAFKGQEPGDCFVAPAAGASLADPIAAIDYATARAIFIALTARCAPRNDEYMTFQRLLKDRLRLFFSRLLGGCFLELLFPCVEFQKVGFGK